MPDFGERLSTEFPNHDEIQELASAALALVQDRQTGPGDGGIPNELESSADAYSVGDTTVRVGTSEDWGGRIATPDMHVVVSEPLEVIRDGHLVKVTIHRFNGRFALFRKPFYTVDVEEEIVTHGPEGEEQDRIPTSGFGAVALIKQAKMSIRERTMLVEGAEARFDEDRYNTLQNLLAQCGPQNRLNLNEPNE